MKKLILIAGLLINISKLYAQPIYATNQGHVLISGMNQDKNILAESHLLKFLINYKTKEFEGKLDVRNIQTGEDSLDNIIAKLPELTVQFNGIIPDDNFITWNHPKIKIKVPVKVKLNKVEKELVMNATLEHFKSSTNYVCSLTGSLEMDISQFNIQATSIANMVNIQFLQLLLRRKE